jgi:hypothetical protein
MNPSDAGIGVKVRKTDRNTRTRFKPTHSRDSRHFAPDAARRWGAHPGMVQLRGSAIAVAV